MDTLTRAQFEEAAVETVRRFHREQQGRSPDATRARVVDDLLIVHSEGAFTATEAKLADSVEGQRLIRSARRDQRALTRRNVEAALAKALGVGVARSFFDMDVRDGALVEVYILERAPFPGA